MPKIERWENLPETLREHLIERMRDRAISIADLNQLRLWIETRPELPEGDWYKDFGSFKKLYFTGCKHAGENLAEVLKLRSPTCHPSFKCAMPSRETCRKPSRPS